MTNQEIAQEINNRIGNSPVPFDSVYSIALEIYQELGGEESQFDSVYSILLETLNVIGSGISAKVIDDYSISLTKTWSSSKISSELADAGFNVEIVTELPSVGNPHTIYFILKQDSSVGDVYDEWMYIDGNWEMIGNTQIDLSDYATLNDISTFITLDDTSMYATKTYVDASLANKADVYEVASLEEIESLFIPVPTEPAANEIWYTTSNGNIITPSSLAALPNIISNTYVDGKGVMVFETELTSIGENAFNGNKKLVDITFPDGLLTIDKGAFNNAFGTSPMTKPLVIPDTVTSIGKNAFQSCGGIHEITFGKNLMSIGDGAFQVCYNTEILNYTGTIAQWNAITKGSNWHFYMGAQGTPPTVVHCSDGNVNL